MKSIDKFVDELIEMTQVNDLYWNEVVQNKFYRTNYNKVRITITRKPFLKILERWVLNANGCEICTSIKLQKLFKVIIWKEEVKACKARKEAEGKEEESKRRVLALLLKDDD